MNQVDKPPRFAIVGHPNKGKSSIVSTLAQDGSVGISDQSGTTTHGRIFPLVADGKTLYELVDTPGFQRPRLALSWMMQRSRIASDHPDIVRQFYESEQNNPKFKAECELLKPLVEGAGILYVVDGSVPYGAEYEAEMEILRWTGQPSMALINQIHDTEFFQQWQQALSQYFRIVRVFNAKSASFDRQLQLLQSFAELNEEWRDPLQTAVKILSRQRHLKIEQSVDLIVELVVSTISFKKVFAKDETVGENEIARYKEQLNQMESQSRSQIEQLFNYPALLRQEQTLETFGDDLFSEQSWEMFGLSKDQLITAGIVSGAMGGGLIDLGAGGLTLFAGSGIGAIVGGVSTWFGGQKLSQTQIRGKSIGKQQQIIGPISNVNFPWVIMGRALAHLQHVCQRTHAQRGPLQVADNVESEGRDTATISHKQLEKSFARLRKGEVLSDRYKQPIRQYLLKAMDDTSKQNS